MHYSSKPGELSPVDFLLEIIGIKIDSKQLVIFKKRWIEGHNSKNGEIGMFADLFLLILMGFLTTHLHRNSQNDVKLLES